MVKLIMRKGVPFEFDVNVDVEFDNCTAVEIIASVVELERVCVSLITDLERKTGLDLHEVFIENITDCFKDSKE